MKAFEMYDKNGDKVISRNDKRWWMNEMLRNVNECENYDGFSNRFVDSIKLCIANIMGTFRQSDMPQFRFIPFGRRKILSFWLIWGKFGTTLVILWKKVSREELKAGHSKV